MSKFTSNGITTLICFAVFRSFCAASYSSFALTVTLVPSAVMSNWSVTSLPVLFRSLTLALASSVVSCS